MGKRKLIITSCLILCSFGLTNAEPHQSTTNEESALKSLNGQRMLPGHFDLCRETKREEPFAYEQSVPEKVAELSSSEQMSRLKDSRVNLEAILERLIAELSCPIENEAMLNQYSIKQRLNLIREDFLCVLNTGRAQDRGLQLLDLAASFRDARFQGKSAGDLYLAHKLMTLTGEKSGLTNTFGAFHDSGAKADELDERDFAERVALLRLLRILHVDIDFESDSSQVLSWLGFPASSYKKLGRKFEADQDFFGMVKSFPKYEAASDELREHCHVNSASIEEETLNRDEIGAIVAERVSEEEEHDPNAVPLTIDLANFDGEIIEIPYHPFHKLGDYFPKLDVEDDRVLEQHPIYVMGQLQKAFDEISREIKPLGVESAFDSRHLSSQARDIAGDQIKNQRRVYAVEASSRLLRSFAPSSIDEQGVGILDRVETYLRDPKLRPEERELFLQHYHRLNDYTQELSAYFAEVAEEDASLDDFDALLAFLDGRKSGAKAVYPFDIGDHLVFQMDSSSGGRPSAFVKDPSKRQALFIEMLSDPGVTEAELRAFLELAGHRWVSGAGDKSLRNIDMREHELPDLDRVLGLAPDFFLKEPQEERVGSAFTASFAKPLSPETYLLLRGDEKAYRFYKILKEHGFVKGFQADLALYSLSTQETADAFEKDFLLAHPGGEINKELLRGQSSHEDLVSAYQNSSGIHPTRKSLAQVLFDRDRVDVLNSLVEQGHIARLNERGEVEEGAESMEELVLALAQSGEKQLALEHLFHSPFAAGEKTLLLQRQLLSSEGAGLMSALIHREFEHGVKSRGRVARLGKMGLGRAKIPFAHLRTESQADRLAILVHNGIFDRENKGLVTESLRSFAENVNRGIAGETSLPVKMGKLQIHEPSDSEFDWSVVSPPLLASLYVQDKAHWDEHWHVDGQRAFTHEDARIRDRASKTLRPLREELKTRLIEGDFDPLPEHPVRLFRPRALAVCDQDHSFIVVTATELRGPNDELVQRAFVLQEESVSGFKRWWDKSWFGTVEEERAAHLQKKRCEERAEEMQQFFLKAEYLPKEERPLAEVFPSGAQWFDFSSGVDVRVVPKSQGKLQPDYSSGSSTKD